MGMAMWLNNCYINQCPKFETYDKIGGGGWGGGTSWSKSKEPNDLTKYNFSRYSQQFWYKYHVDFFLFFHNIIILLYHTFAFSKICILCLQWYNNS